MTMESACTNTPLEIVNRDETGRMEKVDSGGAVAFNSRLLSMVEAILMEMQMKE